MTTSHFLRAAGSVICVTVALHAAAQTSTSAPPASTETMGQHIDDSTITTKVKSELLGEMKVRSTHVHVKTRQGVVWLTGSVRSADDRSAAEDVARNVSGVKDVENKLKVATEED